MREKWESKEMKMSGKGRRRKIRRKGEADEIKEEIKKCSTENNMAFWIALYHRF